MLDKLTAEETPVLAPPDDAEATEVKTPKLSPQIETIEVKTPIVSPPYEKEGEGQTPHSVSSSMYSPTTPAVAHRETLAYNDSKVELEDLTMVSSNSIASVKTFSSDEDEPENTLEGPNDGRHRNDADDDLFEHFNGSTKDLASPKHKQNLLSTDNRSSPLQMNKTRKNDAGGAGGYEREDDDDDTALNEDAEARAKDGVNHKYRNLLRNITPINLKDQATEQLLSSRISKLEERFNDLETKSFKLERESLYVDQMLSNLGYSGLNNRENASVEIQKLIYARGKLQERLQAAKKERYDTGVTLSKLRRTLYGDNSGDMTEYFARNVSN